LIKTSPEVGESIVANMFNSVVLPLPDGPITATNSPSSMVISKLFKALTVIPFVLLPYIFESPLVSNTFISIPPISIFYNS